MSGKRTKVKVSPTGTPVRCVVYTRKSSDEGLKQDFNSLDAQREAGEAYIVSQKAEGWVCLPERYDDGGFSGGNIDRPAMKRLLADIEAGAIDCVVVYKVDRLSRSLMDFARIVEIFERQNVSFVSVTQQINTADSMGRLMLNVLLSFAQFEREIIGERIRDKIAASRRKGKWTGGTPILGFDVDRSNESPRLVANALEAPRVREVFELYLELGSLLPVVHELRRRDWRTKAWRARNGTQRGGVLIDKCRLYNLLTNVLYVGKVRHKEEVFEGEHEGIVPVDLFERVQANLGRNGRTGGAEVRNRHGALLRGLLHCKACGRTMIHTFTTRGNRRYRYYTCNNAIKNGRQACPTASLPAAEIEAAVVDQIRCIGEDAKLLRETLAQARAQAEGAITRLADERKRLERSRKRDAAELGRLASASPAGTDRIAELNERIEQADQRLAEIEVQTVELERDLVTEQDVAAAFGDFDNVWTTLTPREQVRLLQLLVQRVEYDSAESTIEVSFHATGIRALGDGAMEEAA